VQLHRVAVDLDHSCVEAMDSAHALDQSRFAGTIVPQNRQHLPGEDIDVHLVEGEYPTEALVSTPHAQ
jgi:hypothetical protein